MAKTGDDASVATTLEALHRRNAWRLLPLLIAGYVLNTLDKTNIGFASLAMNHDIGLSTAAFGMGAGLFFVTYTLFEIPSNLLMRKVGARVWLSRILISWGLVSMAMALTQGRASYYGLRLLLGVAEAGWYPGVIFYLSLWFPAAYKARVTMLFFLGAPIAAVIGSPLSGAMLGLPAVLGLRNWQWLFLVEGLPTLLLGLIAIRTLRDGPDKAEWLSADERDLLGASLVGKSAPSQGTGSYPARLCLFCLVNFASALGLYSTFIWIPRVVKQLGGLTNLETGFVTGLPYLVGAVLLVFTARSSDQRGERKWHVAAPLVIAGAAMGAIMVSPSPAISLVLLTLAVAASISTQGTLFAMFAEALREANPAPAALAGGLAMITTIGNLGGFAGPTAIGRMIDGAAGLSGALALIAASFAVAGLLLAITRPAALGSGQLSPARA